MSLMRARWILIIALFAASAAGQPADNAEGPTTHQEVARIARAQGELGLRAYEAGRWAVALGHFENAHRRVAAPTFLLFTARCQAKLGQLLRARDSYRGVRDTKLDADAPEQFRQAVIDARTELAALATRIPTLRVKAPAKARVAIDGRPAAAALSEGIQLDPGPHEIVVTLPGGETRRERTTLSEGANAIVDATSAVRGASRNVQPKRKKQGVGAAPLVAFGVGAAGLVVGAVAGAVAWGQAEDVKDQCKGKTCPVGVKDDAEQANRIALASTIGFVIFGVATATGTVLLTIEPSNSTTGAHRLTLGGVF